MRKVTALILSLILLTAAIAVLPAVSVAEPITMWTYFENGNTVNVRSAPDKTKNNVIAKIGYGEPVEVEFINSTGWAVIVWGKDGYGEAYIQARFVVDKKPKARSKTDKEKKAEEEKKELENEQRKLNNELASEREVEPYYIMARPARITGWVNFRVGPGKITTRIGTLNDGRELLVIAETDRWYKARDLQTNRTGYLFKDYATRIVKETVVQRAVSGKQSLGSLNVNGEFELVCSLPEGYGLQVVNKRGTSIVASVQSEDMTKPQLYLSIGYDETYGDVERMNDLTDEELAILEQSYQDMDDVNITYRETGYGTKLLVAKEVGIETDYVDILAIYKGYFIEFNMTPNPNAVDQTLTEAQIGMCIDFLTNLDFVPAN